jgi:hypothetical protein
MTAVPRPTTILNPRLSLDVSFAPCAPSPDERLIGFSDPPNQPEADDQEQGDNESGHGDGHEGSSNLGS